MIPNLSVARVKALPVLISSCLLASASFCEAAVHPVPSAHPTIQAGIAAAGSGDTVLVAPGVYMENLTLDASKSGVVLLSEFGPDSTTIDGNLNRVIRCTNVGPSTRIEGFTIINGRANIIIFGNVLGAGIYLDRSDATVANNVFRDNIAFTAGGAISGIDCHSQIIGNEFYDNDAASGVGGAISMNPGSTPTITNNYFESNLGFNGGGAISLVGAGGLVEGNTFFGNGTGFGPGGALYLSEQATTEIRDNRMEANGAGAGAAIHVAESSPLITGNTFVGNTTSIGAGGAIQCLGNASPEIRENLIVENSAVAGGGGIAIADSSNPVLIRNTIARNSASLAGGGIFVTLHSFPTMQANIVAENSGSDGLEVDIDSGVPVFSCNDVWNNLPTNFVGFADPTGSDGNLSVDPEFCDPDMGNFGVSTTSPCDSLLSPSGCGQIGSEATGCGTVAVGRGRGIPGLNLFPFVPNPASHGTAIRFSIENREIIQLGIYDTRGRRIRALLQGVDLLPGEHRVGWDGRDDASSRVAPGVYFVRLHAGNRTATLSLIVHQ